MPTDLTPIMTASEVTAFLDKEFPQIHAFGPAYTITDIQPGGATLTQLPSDEQLRPGGTISGPTIVTLADLAAYVAILAHIGPVALAVTTNLSINFLRKAELGKLTADCRILKLGRRLAVTQIDVFGEPQDQLIANASATYSIPPNR